MSLLASPSLPRPVLSAADPYALLGGPGYTLPDIGAARAVPFADIATGLVPNIRLASGPAGHDNYLYLPEGYHPKREIRLHTLPSTTGVAMHIGRDLTLHGEVKLFGPSQTVILAGGTPEVGSAGNINVEMWGARALFYAGWKATTNGSLYVVSGDDARLIIGDDCMFATGIHISTHDQHAVMDVAGRRRINASADVLIEPHVWLARQVTVTKGVCIGLGTVVGAQSLVTRSCPRLSVIGGAPAKVIRSGTTWDRYAGGRPQEVDRVAALAETVPHPPAGAFR